MNDYISRQAAISHPFANGQYDHKNANHDFILGHESYKEWLENLPPADVRPSTHSKWLRFMGGSDYQCPECNWGTSYDIPRKFCPNCGADFIGGGADG